MKTASPSLPRYYCFAVVPENCWLQFQCCVSTWDLCFVIHKAQSMMTSPKFWRLCSACLFKTFESQSQKLDTAGQLLFSKEGQLMTGSLEVTWCGFKATLGHSSNSKSDTIKRLRVFKTSCMCLEGLPVSTILRTSARCNGICMHYFNI